MEDIPETGPELKRVDACYYLGFELCVEDVALLEKALDNKKWKCKFSDAKGGNQFLSEYQPLLDPRVVPAFQGGDDGQQNLRTLVYDPNFQARIFRGLQIETFSQAKEPQMQALLIQQVECAYTRRGTFHLCFETVFEAIPLWEFMSVNSQLLCTNWCLKGKASGHAQAPRKLFKKCNNPTEGATHVSFAGDVKQFLDSYIPGACSYLDEILKLLFFTLGLDFEKYRDREVSKFHWCLLSHEPDRIDPSARVLVETVATRSMLRGIRESHDEAQVIETDRTISVFSFKGLTIGFQKDCAPSIVRAITHKSEVFKMMQLLIRTQKAELLAMENQITALADKLGTRRQRWVKNLDAINQNNGDYILFTSTLWTSGFSTEEGCQKLYAKMRDFFSIKPDYDDIHREINLLQDYAERGNEKRLNNISLFISLILFPSSIFVGAMGMNISEFGAGNCSLLDLPVFVFLSLCLMLSVLTYKVIDLFDRQGRGI